MKKLISLIAAATMLFCASAVMADKANNSPSVYIDSTEILFDDQAPVIVEGRTLIPVRGVFEALGCSVDWDGDRQLVTIESPLNVKRIFITIGSDQMRVLTYNTIMKSDEDFITLDVPAQMMNDRTMIPFRVVSETLGHGVEWDNDAYAVLIEKAKDAAAADEKKLAISLSTSAADVKAGDEVVVDLNIENLDLYPGSFLSGITASVKYDKENFDFVKAYMCNENGEDFGAMGVSNPDYTADSLKSVYVTIDSEAAMKADGTIMKFVFTAKNDAKGTFTLADRYNTKIGYDATILVDDGTESQLLQGETLVVDTTALSVNADETETTTSGETAEEDLIADEFIEEIVEDEFVEEIVEDEIIADEVVEDGTVEDITEEENTEDTTEDTTTDDTEAPAEDDNAGSDAE